MRSATHRLLPILGLLIGVTLLPAPFAKAQGGPPMLTEGTGVLSAEGWEINISGSVEPLGPTQLYAAPELDVNYGITDRLTVSVTWPWRVRDRPDGSLQQAPGRVDVGLKGLVVDRWRGWSVSTYPLLCHSTHAPGETVWLPNGWGLRLPVQVSRRLGPVQVAGEVAYTVVEAQSNEISYGLVARTPLTDRLELAGEVGGTGPRDSFVDEGLFVNGGLTAQVVPRVNLNLSVGSLLTGREQTNTSLFAFVGVQAAW